MTQSPVQWTSNYRFMLAAIGMAVGLGNIWRFPYAVGSNGGSAFVMVYLLTLFAIAVPIMIAELLIGKAGQRDPVHTMQHLTQQHRTSPFWKAIGWLSIVIPFLGLSYYSVVAGWTIDYTALAITGQLNSINSENAVSLFEQASTSPWRSLFCVFAFIAVTGFVLYRGLHSGIEKTLSLLMPALLLLLLSIAIWACIAGDIKTTLAYLFAPDFSKINGEVMIAAVGQAFFSISAATGGGMAYAAFLPQQISVPRAIIKVGIADTLVALIAGIAIFPFVFAFDLSPSAGPGLIFQTLPVALAQLPGGQLLTIMFFALLIGAALSTSIAMLNSGAQYLAKRNDLGLKKAVVIIEVATFTVAIFAALSFGPLKHVKLLSFIPAVADKNIFKLLDYAVVHLLIPINAILIVLFCGWAIKRQVLRQWFGGSSQPLFNSWAIIIRFVAPAVLILILVLGL